MKWLYSKHKDYRNGILSIIKEKKTEGTRSLAEHVFYRQLNARNYSMGRTRNARRLVPQKIRIASTYNGYNTGPR